MTLPKTKELSGKQKIFCIIRKKWVSNTPEEWVRQNFISYLIHEKKYPRGLIKVETLIKISGMSLRTDIIVYNKKFVSWMLIECKKPEVTISQKVLTQAGKYNMKLAAKFIVITNGEKFICAEINSTTKKIVPHQTIPDWED
ncbi:MAG: hypothetical protein A3H98_09855 [Bacteroidetes bacterium RIFCSPLOWO2_02_FULL_36_8]|nr:MAG: hypothetical protein A3H98_09855 [Bacteroidetes bacterium RIFCSPLOWO2_02_FULL_36_8]OFY71996.1 MAG: hypothetical protein A3G23_00175 [Bacteroidetes bacterium RIFCSPLOWO2_12_FULL_37_12]